MKVQASDLAHRAKYEIYLDGVNISDAVVDADDVAHIVRVVVRDAKGQPFRRDGVPLGAVLHGHVAIVSKVGIGMAPV